MTPEEVRALAERIADFLARRDAGQVGDNDSAPPAAPVGQSDRLDDAAPTPRPGRDGYFRPSYAELTTAARAAAAGRGPSPLPRGNSRRTGDGAGRGVVAVAISNRHVHLCQSDVERLFGPSHQLQPDRAIRQPGQFAARERLRVVGAHGSIDGVRVVGPARTRTQVELAASDARMIGVDAPIRVSGSTTGSGAVRLEGPAGAIDLPDGAIIAARHLHVSVADGRHLGVANGDRVTLDVGEADRRATLHDVIVRLGDKHETELHLDTDEARAFGIGAGATAVLVSGTRAKHGARSHAARTVVTERDVDTIAAAGQSLSRGPGRVVTPSAIDRAKALGIWRE